MKYILPIVALVEKGDKFHFNQCFKYDFEREQMIIFSYNFVLVGLIYA